MPDQEQVANAVKIVRICLRDDIIYDKMAVAYGPVLGNLLVDRMRQWNMSQPIIQESSSAIRNLVRKPEYCRYLQPESVDVLIEIARDNRFDKAKQIVTQALKSLAKIDTFNARIRQRGGADLLA
mmetsp:Transcript_42095/g.40352  ORF Transcript_42095/g.40352 Transcript_42095/m.40352 type:complete len:125 (-) Transcript_42095:25-399(-)